MSQIPIKTDEEIKLMIEGGRKLAEVKHQLFDEVKVGKSARDIENLAVELISKVGGTPSFKMVPRYHWATCVNINEGVVHGIPKPEVVFKKGDLVSVDVGLFYKGFHTDTSFSKGLNMDGDTKVFLEAGIVALKNAIGAAKAGVRIYDISKAIEDSLRPKGFNPVKALVGHGIGRSLHEDPQIPGVTGGKREESLIIPIGATLAIEIIYAKGSGDIKLGSDGWTITTSDGKISALYEETVAVTRKGRVVLTS